MSSATLVTTIVALIAMVVAYFMGYHTALGICKKRYEEYIKSIKKGGK
jgi:ABC-type spermidine/putrescine transport system permease subunit II